MWHHTPATILVLEEDAAVQELIDQALREAGHRVLCTRDALEVVEVVQRVRIDVLVAGAAPGRELLLGEVRSIQPALSIVSLPRSEDELQRVDHTAKLSSPFSLDDLREAVAAVLSPHEDADSSESRVG